MPVDARELERFGEQFIASFEAIRRALGLYPPNHPTVASQLQRFVESVGDLRTRTGDAKVSLAAGELYVNGVPLKKLSLTHARIIAHWVERGIGLIAFDAGLDTASVLAFFRVIETPPEEIAKAGGVERLVEAAGVRGIQMARVTVGVQAERSDASEAELADAQAYPEEKVAARTIEEAKERNRDALTRLLMTMQEAAAIDARVRVVRNLSQLVEARLLERVAVRDLATALRRHDRESYRHALGGAVCSVLMGSALGLEPRALRLLGEAALLRDVGKTLVDPDVLRDRDRDEASRREYERHPRLGARMLLERWEIDPTAAIVAYEHHARLDLKGFPRLGARKSMHAFSRVVAVASDYDRMTGGYPGCPGFTLWEAVAEIVKGVGVAYDPAAVRGLLNIVGTVPEGTPVKLVDGREGIVVGSGQKSWLAPEVAVLRDASGQDVGPEIVATDGIAPAGESAIASTLWVTERDLVRLDALRDAS